MSFQFAQRRILLAATILFSFVAGFVTSSGLRSFSRAKSEYFWLYEFGMGLFLLLTAASFARQLAGNSAPGGQKASISLNEKVSSESLRKET